MSNVGYILQKYRESAQVQTIMKAMEQPAPKLRLEGLKGAQRALILAAAAESTDRLQLAICEEKEEAAYLFNDLSGLLSEEKVWFFPDSFKRPRWYTDLNPTQMLQRSETINRLTSMKGKGHVLITYPEGLFEKVVRPETLQQHRIDIVKGEKLDVDFVMDVLVEYGFERSDFVYEPGQFSIRGGIIDLFSYGNDLPYRIELFDDEVESIRTFEVTTQLSKQMLTSVRIIPNLNTRFRQDQKAPLLSIVPEGTLLWIKDINFVTDRLQLCFDEVEKFAQKITVHDPAELREIFRDRAFVYPGEILEDLEAMPTVFLM